MIVVYRYARKKRRERQARLAAEAAAGDTQAAVETADGGVRKEAEVQQPTAINAKGDEEKKKELTPEQLAEKKRSRIYRYKLVFGLMAPFTLQALDTTIIASALPFIASDFSQCFFPVSP